MRANSAAEAARAMFVISMDPPPFARTLELANGVEEPLAARFGEVDSPHLLAGVDDQCIRSGDVHLLLNQRAVSQGLNHVAGINSAAGGRVVGLLQLDGHDTFSRADQAIRLSRNAQCVGAQWLSVEGLTGKVLIEQLAGWNPASPC